MTTRLDALSCLVSLSPRLALCCAAALILLLAAWPVPGQAAAMRARTEDGRDVLLDEDGTWSFAPLPPQAVGDGNATAAGSDGRAFNRDPSQDAVVTGQRAPYQFWYDQTKWFLKEENAEPLSEYEFVDASTLVQAMTVAYPFAGAAADLEHQVLATIRASDPEALIIFSEDRMVNGSPVRCLHIKAQVAEQPFVFYFYLHVGEGMAVQAACFTAENVFHALYDELTLFMNGFVAP